jgi:hypothetical protein
MQLCVPLQPFASERLQTGLHDTARNLLLLVRPADVVVRDRHRKLTPVAVAHRFSGGHLIASLGADSHRTPHRRQRHSNPRSQPSRIDEFRVGNSQRQPDVLQTICWSRRASLALPETL